MGILWVIGVFLFFYRPRTPGVARSPWPSVRSGAADAWLGKLAGLSAIVVALVPTAPPPESSAQPPTFGMMHGAAATVLFICLALFPLVLFSQSREQPHVYKRYGWTMLGLLAVAVVYAFAPESMRLYLAPARPILVVEILLIGVFAASWFTKGLELARRAEGEVAPGGAR